MPEDVTKMKVADLKRELKLRGLATTGNKNELQDRLQTALIDGDGDELLEEVAMSGEELLTDEEDEVKILGADENELLKSPTNTPTVPDLSTSISKINATITTEDDNLESPPLATSKKIVLKRKNSFSTAVTNAGGVIVNTLNSTLTLKTSLDGEENVPKVLKMSERNPITMDNSNTIGVASTVTADAISGTSAVTTSAATTKVSQLTLKERMEIRAKKFGVTATSTTTTTGNNKSSALATAASGNVSDEKQLELLKKRAERFGVVSLKMAEIDAKEKLLKRQERFGGSNGSDRSNGKTADSWAEKARLRLERFKTATPTASTNAVAVTPAATSN